MNHDLLKESPLAREHAGLGGRMIAFAGWHLPVQYEGIVPEHLAVRSGVGVFDISHMGQVFIDGAGAEEWLNELLTNNVAKIADGQGQYTLMLNERGGVIDDLILYRLQPDRYFLVVNASMVEEDVDWMHERARPGLAVHDFSGGFGGLAVQGPKSVEIGEKLWGSLPPRNGIRAVDSAYVCRTGYTGEDGFELFAPVEEMVDRWREIVGLGAKPCGLGARDTLRLEMGYPLNGNDLSPDRTPLEAGLGAFVDLGKPFVGRDILLQQKATGPAQRLTAFTMDGAGPPLRAEYAVFDQEKKISEIASGCLSPSLSKGIGMAYLPSAYAKPGLALEVEIRGRRYPVTTCKKPFLKRTPNICP